jgi:aminodeoxychorismate lyase
MPTVVRLNGQNLEPASATVAALDHGFLYGNGLFETLRAIDRRPFALSEHLDRLRRSAEVIGLPLPPSDLLASEVSQALCAAAEPDAYIRLTVTRGPGASGPDPASCTEPTVLVVVRALPAPPERWLTEGLRAITSDIRRNSTSPLTRVKSLNYLECILARQAAKAAGADEALFLDTEGNLAEATAWNLFFTEGGRLLTPSDAGPILPGVTRAIVLRLAKELGIECETGAYPPDRLTAATEAFLTNSLYGIMPLGSLDGRPIGSAVPGPLTSRLAEAYEALRRCCCCSSDS